MTTPTPFVVFGPDHLAALALVVAATGGMIAVTRAGHWPRFARAQEWMLVTLLLASWPVHLLAGYAIGSITWEQILPLQLCDLASFAGAAALIWRHRLAAELTYFWAMAGTLNGLITPALKFAFPHPAFLAFFLLHGAVVSAAFYMVGGLRWWPRPGAVWRAFWATLIYLAVIASVNALLGTNFAFVCRKPETASILDVLGAWPWYVAALIPLGLALYTAFYSPFWLARRLHRKPASPAHPSV